MSVRAGSAWAGRFVRAAGGFLGGLMPAGLVGAFFVLATGRAAEPDPSRLALLVLGWLYAVGVVGLVRLFRVAPWCYAIVGAVAGPVPFALLSQAVEDPEERGGLLVVTALLGVLVGLVEHARVAHRAAKQSARAHERAAADEA